MEKRPPTGPSSPRPVLVLDLGKVGVPAGMPLPLHPQTFQTEGGKGKGERTTKGAAKHRTRQAHREEVTQGMGGGNLCPHSALISKGQRRARDIQSQRTRQETPERGPCSTVLIVLRRSRRGAQGFKMLCGLHASDDHGQD